MRNFAAWLLAPSPETSGAQSARLSLTAPKINRKRTGRRDIRRDVRRSLGDMIRRNMARWKLRDRGRLKKSSSEKI